MRHVIIVGGGFGGLFAARALGRSAFRVTLIDKRNFHTFQPLLYQVATGALTTGDIATPHRLVLRDLDNVEVLMSEVRSIDPERQRVVHDYGQLGYDFLVVATGVQHSYFGQDRWATVAPGLKSLEQALEMRRRIFSALERAELADDPAERDSLMTFAVIGAGPTGVELAGALGELTMRQMEGDYRRIDPRKSKILLIEGSPEVLGQMSPSLRRAARYSLERLGVTILTQARVSEIADGCVRYMSPDGEKSVSAGTVLWAAGVQVSGLGARLAREAGSRTDRSGRLHVGANLSLPGYPQIFVIGDLAHCEDSDGKQVPGLAPAAIQMGEYVAGLLKAQVAGKEFPPFRYVDRGSMAVIGRNHAVGDLRWIRVSGFMAWVLWISIHVMSLIQPEKRLRVFVQWAWRYFSKKTGDRLITGERLLRDRPGSSG